VPLLFRRVRLPHLEPAAEVRREVVVEEHVVPMPEKAEPLKAAVHLRQIFLLIAGFKSCSSLLPIL
jgi:hypothetical protein